MPQSVILLSDIPGLGQIGDRKTVKEGYARNYLLPKHLAVLATSNAINRAERQKGKIEAEKQKLLDKAKQAAEKVSKLGLEFERPVGQGGRLFGSVTPMDIAADLAQHGAHIEKKSILMDGPLKTPGDHVIRVRLHSQVVVDVPVKIIGIETNASRVEAEAQAEEEPTKKASSKDSEEQIPKKSDEK